MKEKDYKRRIILIDKPFQIKISLLSVIFVLVTTLPYMLSIKELIFFTAKILQPNSIEALAEMKNSIIVLLASWQIMTCGLVFLFFIFLTHKIAGPIYKIKKELQTFRKTHIYTPIILRKGDYFSELSEILNGLLSQGTLTERIHQEQKDLLMKELNDLENLDDINAIKERINQIKKNLD